MHIISMLVVHNVNWEDVTKMNKVRGLYMLLRHFTTALGESKRLIDFYESQVFATYYTIFVGQDMPKMWNL